MVEGTEGGGLGWLLRTAVREERGWSDEALDCLSVPIIGGRDVSVTYILRTLTASAWSPPCLL